MVRSNFRRRGIRRYLIAPLFLLSSLLWLGGCTQPAVQPPAVAQNTPASIFQMGILREPLLPVGGQPTQAENDALVLALKQYQVTSRTSPGKVDALEAFLKAYPNSPWRGSLLLDLGFVYRQNGRFTLALSSLQQAWELLRDSKEPKAKALGDLAIGELAINLAYLGRYEALEPLLKEARSRKVSGSSTELIVAASDGLHDMKFMESKAFLCGPLALGRICQVKKLTDPKTQSLLAKARSTKKGTSLAQVQRLSRDLGLNYQMAFRGPGAAVLTPSVAHWRVGHFGALLDKEQGLFPVGDDTAGLSRDMIHISQEALEQESTGYFLVPPGPLPTGWRKVLAREGGTVWGRGSTGPNRDPAGTGPCDTKTQKPCCASHITTWDIHAMLVSLSLTDTPVGGTTSAAFAVPFSVYYSQRDAFQPAVPLYGNLGPKWTHSWHSAVTDLRFDGNLRAVRLYQRGGGVEDFPVNVSPTTFLPDDVSQPGIYSQSVMTFTGTGFVRDLPDGSRETFGKAVGNQYLLTAVSDEHGNTVNLHYSTTDGRLLSIIDAAGRSMSLIYGQPDDPLKITQVVDPFGRSAQFAYIDGRLSSVTDMIGIVSSYQYGDADFIHTLTTPYGVTHFDYQDSSTDYSVGNSRVLTVTDAAGRTYRAESRNSAPGVADQETVVPAGMPVMNGFLSFRNSFYWEPQQLSGGLDYNKATIYHFLHGPFPLGQSTGRTLESIKKPLQRRLWFSYPGQNQPNNFGTSNQPSRVGQVLGDGTTQLDQYLYNQKGNMIQHVDPMGRVFDYMRAANGIDLLSVTTGGQTLLGATYDGAHNVETLTSASGGTSVFTYDSRGLVETSTNELSETTTYGYTPTGNLQSIHAPGGATTTFSFDSQEAVSSATDSAGFTVVADHDEADRPTVLTFPDGTTEVITYDRLDVSSTKDRLERVTKFDHDELRRLTTVTDANNGQTVLRYGLEDAPISLSDPMSRQTQFVYDLQQRLSVKQYADGATQTTTYQGCCGRLKTVTDALGHTKTFSYFLDNMLESIDYSGATPDVSFSNDPFLPRPLSMTDGQGTTTYQYVPLGSPGGGALSSVTGPVGDSASLTYDIAGRMTGRTVNGAAETQNFDALWRTTSTTNALDTFTMSYLGTTGQVTGVNSTSGPSLQYAYGSNLQDRRLAQIKNLSRLTGQVHSQFDFTTNAVGEIRQIIETHGGGSGTPTPTPTNTTTPTPTPTPTVTPPCDDDDDHHHGNHHGNGHHEHGNGNGNGHHNGGNHGNHHNGNNGHHGGKGKHKDKHGSLFFLPDSDDMRTGTTTLVLTLCGLLLASTLRQPAGRRTLVVRLTSLGLAGTLALQGCLIGNIDAGPNTSVVYGYAYDNLSQLVGVNINQTPAASFQFDLAGNLQSLTVGNTTTAQTFNALNQKTTPGVNVYDAKGQTTDKDGRTFEWDDDGRMTAIVDGTHRSEFSYDGYGRRIKIAEFDNGTLTSKKLYWWLGGQIVCERDGIDPGFPLTKRYFGQGVVVGAERLYYTMDQLGSVRELVDSAGVVRSDYRYTPYGERTKVGGDLESDFGFAGLFHHGPSGLDLATYRTYDSKMGRWISRDPLGEGVDYNLYRYCGNNPISGTDPSGLFQVTGDALDRQTYLEYWQAITGYTLDYDPHGDVRITGQTCVKSQSARQRLRDMIRFGSGMTIQLMTLMSRRGSHGAIVVGSPGILSGGDRFHHAIDMADIRSASMGNQNIGQGNFLHENAEAYDIATSGGTGTYEAGHSEAIDAENQYYQDMGLPYHRPQVQTTSLGPHAGQINYGSLQVDIFNNGPVATFVYH